SSLGSALEVGLRLWGMASLLQAASSPSPEKEEKGKSSSLPAMPAIPDDEAITSRIREMLARETLECVLLDRESGKMDTYRSLRLAELQSIMPSEFQPAS